MSVQAIALAISLWLPWVYFGSATRTSFGVFRSAQRLGFDQLVPFRVGWFLLPVIALAVLLFAVLEWRRIALLTLMVVALLIGLPAGVVVFAGGSAWGSKTALVLAILAIGSAVVISIVGITARASHRG